MIYKEYIKNCNEEAKNFILGYLFLTDRIVDSNNNILKNYMPMGIKKNKVGFVFYFYVV